MGRPDTAAWLARMETCGALADDAEQAAIDWCFGEIDDWLLADEMDRADDALARLDVRKAGLTATLCAACATQGAPLPSRPAFLARAFAAAVEAKGEAYARELYDGLMERPAVVAP